ncbi:hypothetical protein B0H63DRAFT_558108 [Podospora didyma]|uniref:Uncharacterized protein n=1 Tax=Podospora didyma TaxID=330526 RepID=A0AAE0P0Y3_9PEZI|nr:hypothetical protein B0H63DRAFT_558108 [Podospora didyma]
MQTNDGISAVTSALSVPCAKVAFDGLVDDVEHKLNDWAGTGDFSSLGSAVTSPMGSSGSDPGNGQTPASQLFANHYKNNADQLSVPRGTPPALDNGQELVDKLLAVVADQGEQAVIAVYKLEQQLASELGTFNVSVRSQQFQCIYVSFSSIAGLVLFMGNFDFVAAAGAAQFLTLRDGLEDKTIKILSMVTTSTALGASLLLGFQKLNGGKSGLKIGRGVSAFVNAILVIPALVVTGYHFNELNWKPDGADRSAAIVAEVANLAGYLSRVSYAIAVNADGEPKEITIGSMMACTMTVVALQTAVALIS